VRAFVKLKNGRNEGRIDVAKFPAQTRDMAIRKKISKAKMRKTISAFCGVFKQKPGEKSVVQELLEERRAEKEKEDRDFSTFQPD
jgi:hypothetical protein